MISAKECVCVRCAREKTQFLPESLISLNHVWCVLIAVIRLGWFKINDKPEFTLCTVRSHWQCFRARVKIAKFLPIPLTLPMTLCSLLDHIAVNASKSSAALLIVCVFFVSSSSTLSPFFRSSILLCNFSRNFIRIIFDYDVHPNGYFGMVAV